MTLEDCTARSQQARRGLRRGRAGGNDARGLHSEESAGSQGAATGTSRRELRQRTAQRGVSRLAGGCAGDEPEGMTLEDTPARSRPARSSGSYAKGSASMQWLYARKADSD